MTLFFSCVQEKVDTQKEGQKLMVLIREWSKSAAADDNDKKISYWFDDTIFISTGQQTLNGKQEIRIMVEGMSKVPGFTIRWEPIRVSKSKSGDRAYMIEKKIV